MEAVYYGIVQVENLARFIGRISVVSNAIQTKDNEANHLIIYCLNCIRHGTNATYEPGLSPGLFAPVSGQFVLSLWTIRP